MSNKRGLECRSIRHPAKVGRRWRCCPFADFFPTFGIHLRFPILPREKSMSGICYIIRYLIRIVCSFWLVVAAHKLVSNLWSGWNFSAWSVRRWFRMRSPRLLGGPGKLEHLATQSFKNLCLNIDCLVQIKWFSHPLQSFSFIIT